MCPVAPHVPWLPIGRRSAAEKIDRDRAHGTPGEGGEQLGARANCW